MSRIALSLAPLLFLSGFAAAQTSPPTQAPTPAAAPPGAAQPAHGTTGHKEREHEGLQTAKVSLAQALDTAESKGPGRAIEADFGKEGGKPSTRSSCLAATASSPTTTSTRPRVR